jgi:hypothetical protein
MIYLKNYFYGFLKIVNILPFKNSSKGKIKSLKNNLYRLLVTLIIPGFFST